MLKGICGFGEKCVYHPKRPMISPIGDNIEMFEELNNLKAEVVNLNYTFKLLMLTRDEVS